MNRPDLRAISSERPDPPYEKTRCNGYEPRVDWQRIRSSKTWRLCPPEQRNNLLRLWLESWNEFPVGSWENDDELIATAIDVPVRQFRAHKDILLRGWILHSDGRFYHPVITEYVLKMLASRKSSTQRVKNWRDKQKQALKSDVTRLQHVGNGTDKEKDKEKEVHPCTKTYQNPPDSDCDAPAQKTRTKRTRSPCPFSKIRELWCEIILPASPTAIEPDDAEGWSEARKTQIRARWASELPDLETWRLFLEALTRSKFLMGKVPPSNGHRQFRLNLFWITKPEYYQRFVEGQYDD
jgi:hypothetical protein